MLLNPMLEEFLTLVAPLFNPGRWEGNLCQTADGHRKLSGAREVSQLWFGASQVVHRKERAGVNHPGALHTTPLSSN